MVAVVTVPHLMVLGRDPEALLLGLNGAKCTSSIFSKVGRIANSSTLGLRTTFWSAWESIIREGTGQLKPSDPSD